MLLVDLAPSRKIRSISRDDLMVVGRMGVRRIYALRTARPLRRRAARTRRPPLVAMRARKPWVLLRLRLFGWYVRFTIPPISSLVLRAKPDDYMGALEHCQRHRACHPVGSGPLATGGLRAVAPGLSAARFRWSGTRPGGTLPTHSEICGYSGKRRTYDCEHCG
jgi:hypothetical protein